MPGGPVSKRCKPNRAIIPVVAALRCGRKGLDCAPGEESNSSRWEQGLHSLVGPVER